MIKEMVSDIGANVTTLIGTPGTLWGEPGYNTDTGVAMWPFPNEDLIKAKMKAYSFTDSNGTVSGKRGFCADGKQLDGVSDITLTSYIWEYLGNKMPAGIYPSGVTINAPSNLTAVSTSSSTVTLTWKDNSSAETGCNIERKTGVKIIGAKDGQGIVNPDKGDVAQITFQGNVPGNYECRIFLPTQCSITNYQSSMISVV